MEHNPFELPQSDGPQGSPRHSSWKFMLVFGWVIFLVLLCLFVVWQKVTDDNAQLTTKPGESTSVKTEPLTDITGKDDLAGSASNKTLEVNGLLKVNKSLVLTPSDPPENPVKGQVYYDDTTNAPMYYDGEKFIAVASKDDITSLQTTPQQVVRVETKTEQLPTVTVDLPADIAQTGTANTFTQDNTFAQDLSVNGFTALQSTSIASLVLGQSLSVASGGTGASSLATNGVLIGGGTGAVSSVTAGSTGLCLMSNVGAPSFQACPTGGGTPNAVTSTANTSGNLARFGAGNTIVDSLLSDNGSVVSVAGNLSLGANNLQLGNSGFGMTLNTTTLTANRSIVLPNESGTVCLQNSSACGFVTGTPANFIQNQNAGAQATANYWIAGVGRADGGLLGPGFDTAASGVLTIGGANATTVNLATNNIAHTINIGTGNADQDIVIGSFGGGSSVGININDSFSINQTLANNTVLQVGLLGEVYLQAGNDSNGALMVKNAAGDNLFRLTNSGIYLQRATSVTGNLTPDVDNLYDLGASGLTWSNGYFGTGHYGSGVYSPSLDTASAGTLTLAGTNASTINIANNNAGHIVNIASGTGTQLVTVGSLSNSSGVSLQAGSGNLNLESVGVIYNRYTDQIVFGNRIGDNHLIINGITGSIVTRVGTALNVEGDFHVVNNTAVFDAGITINNTGGFPNYISPLGTPLQTAINIPNYNVPAYGTILAMGLPVGSDSTARALMVADARAGNHQPTIGILSPDENQVFGFSFEGSASTGYVKTSGAAVGIRLGTNDVALFQGSQIYLNQTTEISGGLRVAADSASALVVQNASAVELLKADTNDMKLTVRELEVTYNLVVGGNLTVGGHVRTTGTTPTYFAGAASCTGATMSIAGTDTAGMITLTAGTGCGATGPIGAVIFADAFSSAPRVTLTPATASAAGLQTFIDHSQVLTTSFDLDTNTPLSDGVTYRWYYQVIQ